MKLTQIEKEKDGKVICKLSGVSPAFMNLIRREILESVYTMAIDRVEFRANDSALYDEMFAHRLGLLPLTTDLKTYAVAQSEEEKDTARCHCKLTLKAKGPCVVYASDLKSKDPKVKPVYPKMIVAKLLKGQSVELEARAVLGKGSEHMKFAPGLPYYFHTYTFKQNKKVDNPEEVIKNCPKGVFKVEKGNIVPVSETQAHLWETILDHVPEGSIDVTRNEDEFLLILESWGQLSCKDILVQAAESVRKTIKEAKL